MHLSALNGIPLLGSDEVTMARFPKGISSAAANAHAAMMRSKKGGGGGGCSVLPFFLILAGAPILAHFF